jgi:hypothetical protein
MKTTSLGARNGPGIFVFSDIFLEDQSLDLPHKHSRTKKSD